jgi:hypothetical protein
MIRFNLIAFRQSSDVLKLSVAAGLHEPNGYVTVSLW